MDQVSGSTPVATGSGRFAAERAAGFLSDQHCFAVHLHRRQKLTGARQAAAITQAEHATAKVWLARLLKSPIQMTDIVRLVENEIGERVRELSNEAEVGVLEVQLRMAPRPSGRGRTLVVVPDPTLAAQQLLAVGMPPAVRI